MKNLIAGNWKLNPTNQKEAKEIFDEIKAGIKNATAEVVVCPPFVYLALRSFSEGGFALGAQNLFWEEKGAFTGEISGAMLKDIGAEYVIIGHSERRKYFSETDEIINQKIKKALDAGLKIIFCVGETEEEKTGGKREEVLQRQIQEGLKDVLDIDNINVAYEPVWAIGTGNNCSVEETKESIEFIRKFVKKDTRVLYGGSVKSENSGVYIKEAGSNGLLVGGASLDGKEFIKIIQSAE
ncbi:MAG: triose-phosphate isomerase [Candidatus Staskawiczbacteria bacterium RIFOXYC1_FULL_37_43]|nr:MAG: triose-phosphate isomerase [Candidatus Staskawiczbacteria bacterium RIFCSPHIGHO2_01_FULL_37_17]OGZ72019.1 MAG: triose-phosphate isomerase [Candidatus Staskawiczbacteria bacterium RIFCSPLOWO2_01_FULL_37_19]OGZ75815.1 MAG: triose-phosphate isomerase [Candidatus Staskawiczbacteria bacterium RIFOXYA1_FULL_37_15]OGZ80705.1 MAG: triose-phosphate isomerase [Candidatus Staskawiczbacteria bacterium RIFOXYB1_FULL_38_37]OGZ82164.1 MAG: triose-phosphate isomerase [Candidatus Staskawiczbacteria bact